MKLFAALSASFSKKSWLLLPFCTAILLSAAMPGLLGWWPLLFVALMPLLSVIMTATPGRSFMAGFFSGCCYYPVLLYWIVIVLNRYGGLPVWLAVWALLFLSLYMSLYLGIFCYLTSWITGGGRHQGQHGKLERSLGMLLIIAPLIWVGLDWVRAEILTGFPWMDLAYGLYGQVWLIQAADLGGHGLITFGIVLINCLIWYGLERWRHRRVRADIGFEKKIITVLCFLLVFMAAYSFLRHRELSHSLAEGLTARVSVVQGNIDQNDKWTAANKRRTVAQYIDLSGEALDEFGSELLVWPETALPFLLRRDELFYDVIDFARERDIWLLTGSPFLSQEVNSSGEPENNYFNSAVLIDPQGEVVQRYNKMHLVPFGEYVPMRKILPFLDPLVEIITDFTAGKSATPLSFNSLRLGVLICFESIFPEMARAQTMAGANLLVNLTNDAWYGRSSAPFQTLAMAVFRAVENRRSLVRAANTGISCFVDPLGNISSQSEIFKAAQLSSKVHLFEKTTVYSRCGHFFGALCFSLAAILLLLFRFSTRFRRIVSTEANRS